MLWGGRSLEKPKPFYWKQLSQWLFYVTISEHNKVLQPAHGVKIWESMKAHHYLSIGIKLFALLLILFSIPNLIYFFENIIYGTVQGMEASLLRSSLIYIPWPVLALILWNFPLSIAEKIIPSDANLSPESISPKSLLTVLISAIAIYFLYRSVMDCVYWATVLNLSEGGIHASIDPESKASIIATFVELIGAAILLFKSKNISNWASKF